MKPNQRRRWTLVALALMGSFTLLAESTSPDARLDALDNRIPVPLLAQMALHQKQNMRAHLESVQGIVAGLAKVVDEATLRRLTKKRFGDGQ